MGTLRSRLGIALFLVFLPALRAHDPGLSVTQARATEAEIQIETGLAPADARALLGESTRPVATEFWEVTCAGQVLSANTAAFATVAHDNVTVRLVYPRRPGEITLRGRMFDGLPPGHRDFLTVKDEHDMALGQKLLRAGDDSLTLPATIARTEGAGENGAARTDALAFFKLGAEHIWTGYDHLLFLFGLLLVCRSFRSIAAIISCFTVAHSITLALATTGLVEIPSRIVEPAIAASIAFVGAENLLRRGGEPRGRWALTFAFGLIHGFGFASALSDLGVGRDGQGLAMPLLTFNLGVEFGQVAIAALVLPIVWRLRRSERFIQQGVPAMSAAVTLAGVYWLLARTVWA